MPAYSTPRARRLAFLGLALTGVLYGLIGGGVVLALLTGAGGLAP